MRWIVNSPVFCLAVLLPVTACGDPTEPPEGWLRADLEGTVLSVQPAVETTTVSFEGTAKFRHGEFTGPLFPSGKGWFSLKSSSTESDTTAESFILYRLGGERLATGEYALIALDQDDPAAEGVTLLYEWRSTEPGDDRSILASAVSGAVVVTSSSSGSIEGSFEAVVVEYCRAGEDWAAELQSCTRRPWEADADTPRMHVTGEFRAVPSSTKIEELEGPLVTDPGS